MMLRPLSPSREPASRPLLAGFALFFFLGTVFFFAGYAYPPSGQPIAFNHAKHVQNGLSCTDCHTGAREQEHATLPALTLCLTCHESAVTRSPEEEKIRTLAAAGKELAWTQLTRVPAHVYFSHRRHVQLAKLDCAVCHGAMEKATAPPRRPYRQMTMSACIECHSKNRARKDCNDCHR